MASFQEDHGGGRIHSGTTCPHPVSIDPTPHPIQHLKMECLVITLSPTPFSPQNLSNPCLHESLLDVNILNLNYLHFILMSFLDSSSRIWNINM